MPSWRVAVLGPGGVGGLLAALLARAGHDVVCVASDSTAEALSRQGLTLHSKAFGDVDMPMRAVTEMSNPVDVCLVTVKATALPPALDRLPPSVVGGALVVPFLNGLDHMELLRQRYPAATVVASTVSVESTRVAPGVIEHTSPFADVYMAGADAFASVLRDAGPPVTVLPDEKTVLWRKLALLAPLALLTSYAEAPIGEVRARHDALLRDVVREVGCVARADGAAVQDETALQFLYAAPDAMKSSMQRDVEAGRPYELDAIGGAVVRAARRHSIAVPATEQLVKAISEAHPPRG